MNWKGIKPTLFVLLAPVLFYQCNTSPFAEEEAKKPNVILIYADDLGYGDVSCYNPQSRINTPNIDQLAAEGMTFTDAHSAASFCTPSRYSILTGKYCWRTQPTSELQGGYDEPIIQDDEMTLGKLFQKNGYRTAAIGKWHVGMRWALKEEAGEQEEENIDFESPLRYTPIDQGFDYYFGTSIYEGGQRVPFIVKWPGKVRANSINDELVGQVDLYATLSGILGHALSENEAPDSYDFSEAWLGKENEKPVRDNYIHLYYAVRQGDWKLIFGLESIDDVSMNTVVAKELYNLKEDPAESNNLVEAHPEAVEALKATFIAVHKQGSSRPQ